MRRGLALLALLALPLLLAACMGGTTEEPEPERAVALQSAPVPERRFDVLRVLVGSGFDYVDPALAYTTESWALLWNVYLPLLTYKHEPGAVGSELVPGLADGLAEISDDGLSYRFTLRDGLVYSDGEPVRAGDFARALARLRRMQSPGTSLFAAVEAVETDDAARTVEFRLSRPQGDFLRALATPFAAPVPAGTKPLEQAEQPVPATGPYRIERYQVGRRVVLSRNPRFRPAAWLAPGNPDRIVVEVVGDAAAARRRVLAGSADYAFHPMPASLREERPEQTRLSTPPNTSYFFLNTQLPPFDRLQVRQAVAFAIDRERLAGLLAGPAAPTQNLLPPGSPAYRPLELYPREPERARELVAAAGAVGERVAVWGSRGAGTEAAARYLVGVLDELGLRARYRSLAPSAYYTTVGGPRSRAQAGAASWFEQDPHPLTWFGPLLHGDRVDERLNTNLSRADVPELNERIDELARQTVLTAHVADEWAELDRLAVEQALVVPFANRQLVELFSTRVDLDGCYVEHLVYRLDLGRLCVRAAA